MSADLMPFTNGEFELSVVPDGDSFRVLAPALAQSLGFRDAYRMLETVPDSEKGYTTACTPGGDQRVSCVTEAGFYRVIGQRQAARITDEDARASVERFQTWVYADVLPAIRRHGGYLTPALAEQVLSDPDTIIRLATDLKAERAKRVEAELLAAETVAALEEASPKARAWETFLSGSGDMSVADAAKALARADVVIGATRLFRWLIEHRWAYRAADGAPRAMQDRIDAGHLRHKPQGHYHPSTGEWVIDPPQIRVMPRGLELLAKRVAEPNGAAA